MALSARVSRVFAKYSGTRGTRAPASYGKINLAEGVPASAGMTTILEIRRFQLSLK
jgi:hypothetical protein